MMHLSPQSSFSSSSLTRECEVTHTLQVRKAIMHRFQVSAAVVLHAVLLEHRANARGDDRVAVLRHGGEEVVLNLEVEVRHPPVAPPRAVHVHRVDCGVAHPVGVFVLLQRGKVCVRHGEVEENVVERDGIRGEVKGGGIARAERICERSNDGKACCERRHLGNVLRANYVARVKVELPTEPDELVGDGDEQPRLQLEPRLECGGVRAFEHILAEGDERERVEVNVVSHLLRRGVVLVVLVAPPRRGHAAAGSVQEYLQGTVHLDVPRERVVPTLVHEPTAPSLHDSNHDDGRRLVSLHPQCDAGDAHHGEFREPVHGVRIVRLEESFLFQLHSQFVKVTHESIFRAF
mmetsp:Transcript_11663/g.30822  ORF Transcript_11663/g.30822 Transcript_11663/m.30822 type:complete len:348 (+) Transcript_11663:453-1496(+)